MQNTILARRYAKALFAVGKEENALEEYGGALNELADLINNYPEVKDALTNVLYPLEVRTKVMEKLTRALNAGKILTNFLNLVVQKKRTDVLPDIAEAFQAMFDEERNICQGTIVTASELSSDLKDKVRLKLEKITGKNVVLTAQVDPAIIGGIVAKVGDLVMDGSIKTQLLGLQEAIKGSE